MNSSLFLLQRSKLSSVSYANKIKNVDELLGAAWELHRQAQQEEQQHEQNKQPGTQPGKQPGTQPEHVFELNKRASKTWGHPKCEPGTPPEAANYMKFSSDNDVMRGRSPILLQYLPWT